MMMMMMSVLRPSTWWVFRRHVKNMQDTPHSGRSYMAHLTHMMVESQESADKNILKEKVFKNASERHVNAGLSPRHKTSPIADCLQPP